MWEVSRIEKIKKVIVNRLMERVIEEVVGVWGIVVKVKNKVK